MMDFWSTVAGARTADAICRFANRSQYTKTVSVEELADIVESEIKKGSAYVDQITKKDGSILVIFESR